MQLPLDLYSRLKRTGRHKYSNYVEVHGVILMAIWPFESGCFISDSHHVALWSSCLYLFARSGWTQPREANWSSSFSPGVAPCWAPVPFLWPDLEPTAGKILPAGHSEQVLLMTHTVWIYFIQFETHWACDSSHSKPVCFFLASILVWKSKKMRGIEISEHKSVWAKSGNVFKNVSAACVLCGLFVVFLWFELFLP